MNYKKRSSDSLCERSMKMVTNVLRLSSLSIASMSLGTTGRSVSAQSHSAKDSSMMADEPVVPQFAGSRRSQEPQSWSKPVSYLVELEDGIESAYVFRDDKNVDGMASDYIERVHKKNQHYCREASEDSPIILPPPPSMLNEIRLNGKFIWSWLSLSRLLSLCLSPSPPLSLSLDPAQTGEITVCGWLSWLCWSVVCK
ncbi:uncharacterized protein LOC115678733 isoform X2 [Syzygium oleosum]|uniref:uncharacterized protein LOC115678733 isoform X2 n=1 Tax=Syzygium oleosum TaxID=219896 RepID=UPI0024BB6AA8|nr:uncharacterized protein LOC115678733 isoform X2 [Syzygium oleosum]